MLLLLPPSRGQTAGPAGSPTLDLSVLSLPSLTEPREKLLAALAGTGHDPSAEPTAPAAEVLTGVLFAAADLPGLLRRRALADAVRSRVLVASPLLGMVGPTDPIPASRLAMGTVEGIGGLGPFWRPACQSALDGSVAGRLVVDVRSSEFAGLWRPPDDATWVTVRVEQEVDGVRRTVSHFAKHWRGVLIHHLLVRRGAEPSDARGLLRVTRGLVRSGALLGAELAPAARPGAAHVLTLVTA